MIDLMIAFDKIDENKPLTLSFDADEKICQTLAERFGWLHIYHIKGEVTLSRLAGQACYMKGKAIADITQACVVTEAPVRQQLDIRINERFAIMDTPKEEELIDPMSVQTEPMFNRMVPVGETIAQLLARWSAPSATSTDTPRAITPTCGRWSSRRTSSGPSTETSWTPSRRGATARPSSPPGAPGTPRPWPRTSLGARWPSTPGNPGSRGRDPRDSRRE